MLVQVSQARRAGFHSPVDVWQGMSLFCSAATFGSSSIQATDPDRGLAVEPERVAEEMLGAERRGKVVKILGDSLVHGRHARSMTRAWEASM